MHRIAILLVILFAFGLNGAAADPPTDPANTFSKAKQKARDEVYFDRKVTFYCACAYIPTGKSGGRIDPSDCGFVSPSSLAKQLQWEHVVPASVLAATKPCGSTGHPSCSSPGRRCCEKSGVDQTARNMINDLHNLVPSIGKINNARSDYEYGEVNGEPRDFGVCDFEVGGSPKKAEPHPAIRGNIARIWKYMAETYNVPMSTAKQQMLDQWSQADPVGEWELLRDARIEQIQGNRNPHVRP